MKAGTATVVKNAGSHFLLSELPLWQPFPAVLKGKVRLLRSEATNPVAVGDRVRYELDEGAEDQVATISEVLERKNYVIRKSTNLSRQSHVIAANLDQAVLAVSLFFPEIKLSFLDRLLVTCEVYDKSGTKLDSVTDSIESYVFRGNTGEIDEAVLKFADSAYNYFHPMD